MKESFARCEPSLLLWVVMMLKRSMALENHSCYFSDYLVYVAQRRYQNNAIGIGALYNFF